MKKGEICTGYVERVSFPNRGRVHVLTCEGVDVSGGVSKMTGQEIQPTYAMVKNVLPGQEISFRINKKKNGNLQGQFLEVLKSADSELSRPNCPHFGICGGCTYQTLPYEEQLAIKEEQVKELLRPVLGADYVESVWDGITGSMEEFAYRNKMEFSFGDEIKDGPLTLGMHKRGSFYDVVNVEGCCLIHDDIRKVLVTTYEYFAKTKYTYYHKMSHEGYLRHLLIRRAGNTSQMIVDLVTSTQIDSSEEESLIQGWKDALLALDYEGDLMGILHTHNDRVADIVEDQGTSILYGQDYITENLLGLSFKITPFSFFQNNSKGAEKLYSIARDYVMESMPEDGPVVYDLYSGTGTIAQMISPAAKEVIGVEIVAEAVEAAEVNAGLNGLENCSFIAGDVLKVLDDIETKPDYIILDPPRDGINPKALEKIIDYGVQSIVYISCSPRSLARDLVRLKEDYDVKGVHVVDMFPGTGHVETVVLLSKMNTPKG